MKSETRVCDECAPDHDAKYSLSACINNGTPELLVYRTDQSEHAICVPLDDEMIKFLVGIREYIVALTEARDRIT
jgi:hypothetical protein